jgi:hypothetical protein
MSTDPPIIVQPAAQRYPNDRIVHSMRTSMIKLRITSFDSIQSIQVLQLLSYYITNLYLICL